MVCCEVKYFQNEQPPKLDCSEVVCTTQYAQKLYIPQSFQCKCIFMVSYAMKFCKRLERLQVSFYASL